MDWGSRRLVVVGDQALPLLLHLDEPAGDRLDPELEILSAGFVRASSSTLAHF